LSSQENVPFACECEESMRIACKGEPFFGEYEGKHYCVFHFPDADKRQAFDIAVKRKIELKDFNFQGVWFSDGRWFSNLDIAEPVNFRFAVFNDRASFYKTVFRDDVSFEGATFNDSSSFEYATFVKKVEFSSARFQKDANCHKTRFGGYANFWRCTFTGRAVFDYAEFHQTASFWPTIFDSIASFSHASFVSANFRASEFNAKAVFSWCAFGFAEFIDASFSKDADFFAARFEGMANFAHAKFDTSAHLKMSEFGSEARFTSAIFNGEADFSHTVFKDFVSFSAEYGSGGFGINAACDFRYARFETPRRISFHSITLRPHWFVNLDPREFQFIDVKWIGNLGREYIDIEIGELRKREELEEKRASERRVERLESAKQYDDKFEIERLKREEVEESGDEANVTSPKRTRFYRLLSITCRQLAVNAEESHRYDQASDFRFWSMELKRKEGWGAQSRLSVSILHSLYRHLSGYGEDIGRAFGVLIGIWLIFAFLYTQVGFVRPPSLSPEAEIGVYVADEVGNPLKLVKALSYSLAVMILQRPDPRPVTAAASFAVLAESILGPIQAALFALAVRRRFMR
jgi:uncharacterized protein YjbI with pentapeptide repeats